MEIHSFEEVMMIDVLDRKTIYASIHETWQQIHHCNYFLNERLPLMEQQILKKLHDQAHQSTAEAISKSKTQKDLDIKRMQERERSNRLKEDTISNDWLKLAR